jgi:hypothetical protein
MSKIFYFFRAEIKGGQQFFIFLFLTNSDFAPYKKETTPKSNNVPVFEIKIGLVVLEKSGLQIHRRHPINYNNETGDSISSLMRVQFIQNLLRSKGI